MDKVFEINWASLWRVFIAIIFAWFLFLSRDVLIAVFLAIVISSALDSPVSWLEKKRIPRILGALGIFLIAVLVVALVAYTIVPLAIFEINNFLSNINKASGAIFDILQSSEVVEALNKSLTQISNALIAGNISLADIVSNFLGGAFLALSVFVLSFYLTLGKDGVEKFLIAVLPPAYEDQVVSIYAVVRRKIGRWLEGQIFLSLAMGVLVFLGLWLLGVKYSLTLGILAGILELVPFVGPIFAGSLTILVTLSNGTLSMALYVLLLFIAIQQLENHVLVPAVTKFTTSLNPVVVIIALLAGGQTFGFIGLILAVPVAVFVQEILENWTQTKARRRAAV